MSMQIEYIVVFNVPNNASMSLEVKCQSSSVMLRTPNIFYEITNDISWSSRRSSLTDSQAWSKFQSNCTQSKGTKNWKKRFYAFLFTLNCHFSQNCLFWTLIVNKLLDLILNFHCFHNKKFQNTLKKVPFYNYEK